MFSSNENQYLEIHSWSIKIPFETKIIEICDCENE
jgi:hypothetical protein